MQNELVPVSQFPFVSHMANKSLRGCLHTGITSNDVFGFWFLFIFFFFLIFLELLPKSLKIVKDAAVSLAQHFVSNAHLSS